MLHLVSIAVLIACLIACSGYGSVALRLLRVGALNAEGEDHGCRDRMCPIYSLALGMGILAYAVLAAGLLGALTVSTIAGLLALGWFALGVVFLPGRRPRKDVLDAKAADPSAALEPEASRLVGGGALGIALGAYLVVLIVMTLVSALRPIDGLEWDTLSYHLAAPKIYLQEGRIAFIAYDSHTHFPFTMQMLYTTGLAIGGPVAARLFHWAAGWLTAWAVGAWTARLQVGGRAVPSWCGPLSAALFASMPLVLWEMGTAYVDLGTALFQFLALAALLDAVDDRDGRLGIDPRRALLAGVLSGFALGTKMTALLQFGLLGLGLLWLLARVKPSSRSAVLKTGLGFGAVGLLVGSPWYIKSWLWVHNPVYPFFYSVFPGSFSWNAYFSQAYAEEQRRFGVGRGPADLLRSLWDLGLHGREFFVANKSVVGDYLGSLGPVWAGILPLAPWSRDLGWRAWALLAYGLGSVAIWFFLSQQSRYLMPAFAPLAAAGAVIIAALTSRALRIAAALFTGAALLLNANMHVVLVQRALPVVMGQVGVEDYLLADPEHGAVYEAARFANRLPESSRIAFFEENRGFYFDRKYFWANPGQHDLIRYGEMKDGEALARELKRFGITHVLVNYGMAREVQGADYYRKLMMAIQSGAMIEVFRSRSAEFGRRGVILYRLQ